MAEEVVKRLINVDEYYKMAEAGILKPGDRVELINGEIFEMSPIGSKHAAIIDRLARILNQLLSGKATIRIQNPVRIDKNNEPEPDVSVLKFRPDDYASSHPEPDDVLIIIEVADSSIHYDKKIKKPLYASCGIPEYWIIGIENDVIEVFAKPKGKDYSKVHTYESGDEINVLDKIVAVKDLIIF